MLNILEYYNLDEHSRDSYQVNHYLIEAMKFAFGHRMSLGDENFLNITTLVQDMQNKDYASMLRQSLLDVSIMVYLLLIMFLQTGVQKDLRKYLYNASLLDPQESVVTNLMYPIHDHGTSHMSAVDSDRMAVALTSTVNLFFGSQVLSEKTGILYNDQMDDFSIPNATNAYNLPPTENNFVVPGKRPLSSMSPTIVHKNGKFFISVGASGGPYIMTATLQTLINMIDFNMDTANAIQTSRLHHQLLPNELAVETGFPVDALSKLIEFDEYSKIDIVAGEKEDLGVVQGIKEVNGILQAASDIRKKSIAVAY
jgi:gamma-glutamyltranspeptidase/glutathione hydrolase/leukotriene-C4 hydrolase